jgi:hypothetical protein
MAPDARGRSAPRIAIRMESRPHALGYAAFEDH